MSLKIAVSAKANDGVQGVYTHRSSSTGTDMTFSVFVPAHTPGDQLPILWFLSGLTCTHANVTDKGGYRAACAKHGIIFIAPDTSPRGEGVPDIDVYDFGQGAGFYVDATRSPWATHFQMRRYIESELPAVIAEAFPMADMSRQGITGHSMGGHGALTMALRDPSRFRSVSAFAPIVAPMRCPWGQRAFEGYLGEDQSAWREYDACALIKDGARLSGLLIDQGTTDSFLAEQLKTELLSAASQAAGMPMTLRMQPDYDHSYYFISTFMPDQIAWHAAKLKA